MKHSQASNKIALLAKLLQQRKQSYSSPLSYGQQALWFIHQNAPESSAYNMAWAIQIEGKLQKEEFDKALQSMVERHPALRTAIHQVDGVPQQVVATSGECTLSEHLLMGASETIRSSAMHAVYGQAFDLEHGKAFRVDIFQTSAKQHCLLLTMHHIMGDATALNLLGNELLLLYRANITGNKPELAVISSTIADFVRDEQAMLDSETGAKMLCYWQKALENHAPLLSLPTDFPRPDVQHYDGASVPFALSQQQSTQIKALAKQQKSTLFAVLLTVFQVLLFRYTGQHDICIGTPTSTTRLQKTKFANLIAYLVNPVVLRANIDTPTTLTFLDLLEKNKQTVLEAVKHASYPFPLLVKHINVERDGRYPPLFQVMLDFKPAGFLPISNNLPDLTVSAIDFPQMEGQFDLTLSIADGDILQGCLKYNSELFHQKTIEHMVEHLKTLLTAIIDTPTQAIATLPLLAIQEAQQLQVWNNTARDYPNKDQTIVDLFEQQVQKTPDNIAVIFEKQQLTYQELNEQANQLAHYLCPLSSVLRPLIALAMDRSLGMVISLLAVFKTGAAYVPIDPSYPEARIAYMLDDSGAELLLTQSYLLAKLQRLTSGIRRVICIDTLNLAPQLKDNPVVDRQASDLAYVIYTSGSTGKPKGAMNAHAGIINRLLWMQETFQLTASDRVLQKTPCSFDVSVWEFFWPLITGAALVVAKPEGHKDPSYLTALIAKKQITTLHFVPSMLPHFLDHADPLQCASLTRVMCSGEALSVDLNRRFFYTFFR